MVTIRPDVSAAVLVSKGKGPEYRKGERVRVHGVVAHIPSRRVFEVKARQVSKID